MTMYIYKYDIVFQEIPGHIALAFYVCGCPLKCPGCHSPDLWTEKTGFPLTAEAYSSLITRYKGKADCILFMGGEWRQKELMEFLGEARRLEYKTALYTGLEHISPELESLLNFLKTGPWMSEKGGLASPTTNQIFKDLTTNTILNHLFQTESNNKE